MTKKLLSFALAAVALVAMPAAAQTSCGGCKKAATEACCKAKAKADDKCCGKCGDSKALFEGVTLSPEQQKAVEALKVEKKQAAKEAVKNHKEAGKAARAEYLAKLKTILTPEQFAQVEKNMSAHHGKDGKHAKHAEKHGKKAHKGDCCGK